MIACYHMNINVAFILNISTSSIHVRTCTSLYILITKCFHSYKNTYFHPYKNMGKTVLCIRINIYVYVHSTYTHSQINQTHIYIHTIHCVCIYISYHVSYPCIPVHEYKQINQLTQTQIK